MRVNSFFSINTWGYYHSYAIKGRNPVFSDYHNWYNKNNESSMNLWSKIHSNKYLNIEQKNRLCDLFIKDTITYNEFIKLLDDASLSQNFPEAIQHLEEKSQTQLLGSGSNYQGEGKEFKYKRFRSIEYKS